LAAIYLLAAIGRGWRSRSSAASGLSVYSLLSFGSLLSVLSLFSVGSAGSILSIGSAGSILCIGSAGSLLSFGGAGRRGHFRRPGSLERGAPMEPWQLDVVHGFLLADGTSAEALTGVDDHSRYHVSAPPMARERTQSVCDGFTSALRTYGVLCRS
jgi:hypothetical protein